MFDRCSSLVELPDISIWNTKQITNMSNLFCGCSSLKYLPDISKWDISNVNNIYGMFGECSSIEILPDIIRLNNFLNYHVWKFLIGI